MNEKLLTTTQAILTGILALIIYSCIVQLWRFDLHIPIDMRDDAVLTAAFIKTIIQVGNYWSATQYIGYPEIFLWKQYPAFSPILFYTVWLFSQFTDHYALVLNLTYLTSIFLVSFSSFLVFRYLGINAFFATVAAILYCFLPYHFLRGEAHLTLSAYFTVPCWVYLCLEHFRGRLVTKMGWLPRMTIFKGILLLILAMDLIYYWYFGLLCLLVVGLIRAVQLGKLQPVMHSIFISLLVGSIAIILSIPSISYIYIYGFNKKNVSFIRSFVDTEYLSLKITNLVLPISNHFVKFMATLTHDYAVAAPLVNENLMAALGLIGTIGFLILIFVSLAGPLSNRFSTFLRELSVLNLLCLLTASIGGIGTLIAFFLFSGVRAYNRISVYIAFFSIAAFFIVLQSGLHLYNKKNKSVYCIGITLLILGLLDQVGKHPLGYTHREYLAMKSSYLIQKDFVKEIESKMPAHSAIFELPNLVWGEASHAVTHIGLFTPYLQSATSYWSFGAMNGNPVSNWQYQVGLGHDRTMLDQILYAGFTGLHIDRNGYADHGAQIEGKFNRLLKKSPLISADQRYAFYDLREDKLNRKTVMGTVAWEKQVQEIKIKLAISSKFKKEFITQKSGEEKSWVGSDEATLVLVNYTDAIIAAGINFTISKNDPLPLLLTIQGGGIKKIIKIASMPTVFSERIRLLPGKTIMLFSVNADQRNVVKGNDKLHFTVSNFKLSP